MLLHSRTLSSRKQLTDTVPSDMSNTNKLISVSSITNLQLLNL